MLKIRDLLLVGVGLRACVSGHCTVNAFDTWFHPTDEDGPTFQTRKGGPVKSDLGRALELLHAQGVCMASTVDREPAGDDSVAREKLETRSKDVDVSGEL